MGFHTVEDTMNKSLITNLSAAVLIVAGYFSPWYSRQIYTAGIFAISGALTNWLAVHMLFDKVPLVYGSGIIPLYFEDLKRGIKELIMDQFFQEKNLARFIDKTISNFSHGAQENRLLDLVDYDAAFDAVKEMVLSSGIGAVLSMFGGEGSLEKYRPVFKEKVQEVLIEQISSPDFKDKLREKLNDPAIRTELLERLEELIEDRLKELTPLMVKEMIQKMIRRHLGWLVVWGGIFGGIIGLVMSFISP